jgi:hypothetical protein
MKRFEQILCFVLFVSFPQFAQDIPNAGFENWTESNPDDWYTQNIFELGVIPVTQTSTSHSGSSAVRLEIINSTLGPILPLLQSGETSLNRFQVNQSHGSLNGYYQFSPVGGDYIRINVLMFNDTVGLVGSGTVDINNAVSSYTQFAVPIEYIRIETPDLAFISFLVLGDSINIGSFALIDDLSWGGPVGIQEVSSSIPEKFELRQNYPNPFNPSTTIEFTIPEETFVELKVFDILGKEVAVLVNDNYTSGIYKTEFNGDNLPSGIYIAKMNAGSFTKSFKMMLLK